ncbi:uncharacterized protein LOC126552524 isoform X1 [Aphis gossypii]|uniref:uncharacterized protein LOC126552524 isoform X1 n=1 Tax=Aphis gossypii TaxID=80765 RepID=UPI0021592CAF|nr:uncharacterized protein LOC126552524 isoform X1 [Aphis gossypii]
MSEKRKTLYNYFEKRTKFDNGNTKEEKKSSADLVDSEKNNFNFEEKKSSADLVDSEKNNFNFDSMNYILLLCLELFNNSVRSTQNIFYLINWSITSTRKITLPNI